MRIHYDSEFVEDGKTIDPLSLAFVAANDERLYIVIQDQDPNHSNDFVDEFVRPYLSMTIDNVEPIYLNKADAGKYIENWVARQTDAPEFWAWYADYDWVLLCQLFGRMLDLPRNWPMFCRDLKQEYPKLKLPTPIIEHHALADTLALRDGHIAREKLTWIDR